MLFFYVSIISALVFFTAGSITDIKKKEVPDFFSGSFIILSIFLRFFWILKEKNFHFFMMSVAVPLVILPFSYLLYKFRMWGGGDSKLLIGASIALSYFPGEELPFFAYFIINLFTQPVTKAQVIMLI